MQNICKQDNRVEYLDYVKAICLFFVLLVHRDLQVPGLGAFILPAFFLLSGYMFSASQKGFREYALKRARRLLVPFWLTMLVYAPVEVIRACLLGYGDASVLVPMAMTTIFGSCLFPCAGAFGQYVSDIVPCKLPEFAAAGLIDTILPASCALWFLPALFSANIICFVVISYRKASFVRDALTILALLLLASLETIPGAMQFPYALGRGFFGAALMLVGRMLREADIFGRANIRKQMAGLLVAVPVSVFSMLFDYRSSGLIVSVYGPHPVVDVFVFFACGLGFSYVLICLCKGLEAMPLRPVHRFLSAAGTHSMGIYLWHMLVFFLGDSIVICCFNVTLSPDVFLMECFSGQLVAYRCFMVLFAFSLLTALGCYRTSRTRTA